MHCVARQKKRVCLRSVLVVAIVVVLEGTTGGVLVVVVVVVAFDISIQTNQSERE